MPSMTQWKNDVLHFFNIHFYKKTNVSFCFMKSQLLAATWLLSYYSAEYVASFQFLT